MWSVEYRSWPVEIINHGKPQGSQPSPVNRSLDLPCVVDCFLPFFNYFFVSSSSSFPFFVFLFYLSTFFFRSLFLPKSSILLSFVRHCVRSKSFCASWRRRRGRVFILAYDGAGLLLACILVDTCRDVCSRKWSCLGLRHSLRRMVGSAYTLCSFISPKRAL